MKLKLSKYTLLLILIIGAGLFFRLYKSVIYLPYGHDNDLAGWVIKDILLNKHLRLVGQETSTQGIYIGALYYYLLIPFYLLTKMEPTGGIILSAILGAFTVWSVFFVFKEVFKKKEVGLIGAGICAVAYAFVMNDRGNVPTTPVILWSVWFLYAVGSIFSREITKSYVLLGILIGLTWHLNVTLVLLTILIPAALIITRWKFDFRKVFWGLSAFLVTSTSFFVFELRHNFLQTRAVISSFLLNQGSELTLVEQGNRVLHIFSQIVTNIFWYPPQRLNFILPLILLVALIYLAVKKKISKNLAGILVLWSTLPVAFFSFYSKQVSEYYLNGVLIIALSVISLSLYYILTSKYRIIGFLLLGLFAYVNFYKFFTYQDSRQGYIWRRALVLDIKKDALEHGYPCVAVSYITNPGYELGYRYFFWLASMHVNRPESGSPVYTIVFPLNDILFPTHKNFGALGLIYPDYKRYTKEKVRESCNGQNSNLTDPLFGFTE